VDEQCGDGAVDAARERTQHPVAADAGTDAVDLLLDHGGGRPGGRRAGDPVEEVLQHLLAALRVHDLGVELDRIEAACLVFERSHRRGIRGGRDRRAGRRRGDRVAVGHPHGQLGRKPFGQRSAGSAEGGLAELAGSAVDAAAETLRHQVHAVADAERRHAELEHAGVDLRRPVHVHGRRPAGQDQRDRVPATNLRGRGAMRHELRVDARLAHAARDQLRVLTAEVEHEHGPLLRERVQPDDLSGGGNSASPS
jgi:hypothetical protein